MVTVRKNGLTTPQLACLNAMHQFGPMAYIGSTVAHYRAGDGSKHAIRTILNLSRDGLVYITTTKRSRVATITTNGRQRLDTPIKDIGKPRRGASPEGTKRKLSPEEIHALSEIANRNKVFYDDATRSYDGLDWRLIRRMASYVWIAVTPKHYAEILPAGLRALRDREVWIL